MFIHVQSAGPQAGGASGGAVHPANAHGGGPAEGSSGPERHSATAARTDEPASSPRKAGEGEAILGATLDGLKRAAAQVEIERAAVEALHRSLLPRLPTVPGLRFAARSRAGVHEMEIGGDWYDAFVLPDGSVALAIGDVVGRGVEAAARMAHLQSAVRVYARENLRPALVLERLNTFVLDGEEGGMLTLLYAVVDPDARTMRVASAGHPPPLVLSPKHDAPFAEIPAASPLGMTRFAVYEEGLRTLDPRSTVLFYTDGLVEGPDLPLSDGLESLSRCSSDGPLEPEALCRRVMDSIDTRAGLHDDLALLAVQLTPPEETLDLVLSPRPGSLDEMRRALAQWLRSLDADENDIYETLVASGEACANAVAHAHPPVTDQPFEFHARRDGADVEIRISDTGRWRSDDGDKEARGLMLMRTLMDDLEIDRGAGGTIVTMRRRLGGERRSEVHGGGAPIRPA
jgi:serine phosphatase RsbU (regulator of sigma subunit)/anti-sigma regulatory factor (Ser/Thr protein kinase)